MSTSNDYLPLLASFVAGAGLASLALFAAQKSLASSPQVSPVQAENKEAAVVSERTKKILENDTTSEYLKEHFHRFHNPEYLCLTVAENKFLFDILEQKLKHRPYMALAHMGYDNMMGNNEVRKHIASFMSDYIAHRPIDPRKITLTSGTNAAIDALFWSICDEGDYFLVPTPYYAAFEWDLGLKAGVKIYPVPLDAADNFKLSTEKLMAAYETATKSGLRVKGLLLSNPNNPLGVAYSREDLAPIWAWVKSLPGFHLVVDEIYACSLHTNKEQFCSIANLLSAEEMACGRAHLIYGFSKDFGISGFRAGVLYTENNQVIDAMGQYAPFAACSNDVQQFLASVLGDKEFLASFISSMQDGLTKAYNQVLTTLDEVKIPHLPAVGGLFCWIDLRQWLKENSAKGERDLWFFLLDKYNINLTPGLSNHCSAPGFFRLCFATLTPDKLKHAIETLKLALDNFHDH